MSAHEDIARLLREAAASMKSDPKSAVAKLEDAYELARGTGVPDDAAVVAEELARGGRVTAAAARRAVLVAPRAPLAMGRLVLECLCLAQLAHRHRRLPCLDRARRRRPHRVRQ